MKRDYQSSIGPPQVHYGHGMVGGPVQNMARGYGQNHNHSQDFGLVPGPMNNFHHNHGQQLGNVYHQKPAIGKQLMSFQNYVRTLNNNVDETTACRKYKDFMASLSQSKVGRFFEENKDREWFRSKYHPIDNQIYLKQASVNFMRRLQIFNELNEMNYFDSLSFTKKNESRIVDLMDAIIVKLEDGPEDLINNLMSHNHSNIDLSIRRKYISDTPISVVLDEISIESSLSEIQELCLQASPNLIRLARLDPYYVEGGVLKQKVVAIFKESTDIRDVCWKLSRMKLNNRSFTVSVNKCLVNRTHIVPAVANHHVSIISDIRNAINIILNLDELKGLYGKRRVAQEASLQSAKDQDEGESKENQAQQVKVETEPMDTSTVAPPSPPGSEKSGPGDEEDDKQFDISSLDEEKEKEKRKLLEFKFNIDMSMYRQANKLSKSKNPILQDAYRYLVEYIESTSHLYQLSKVPTEVQEEAVEIDLDKNENDKFYTIESIVKNLACSLDKSTKFLDTMLWYLRIVHSFDYYKKTIYKQEDELTLRMSVIHLRDDLNFDISEGTGAEPEIDSSAIKEYLENSYKDLEEFNQSQTQKYVTKDEERFNYKSYGKVITDELESYSQRILKPKSTETEEVYKCKHCTREFHKLTDIGRHFVSKHRWAIDAIELDTDYFNTYLFDCCKIDPCPPKKLLEVPINRFAKMNDFVSQMGEDPDLLQQTLDAYNKMESFVREPAPRAIVESDPRNESIVDYGDISFDDVL